MRKFGCNLWCTVVLQAIDFIQAELAGYARTHTRL
jgi:hypothetical protein